MFVIHKSKIRFLPIKIKVQCHPHLNGKQKERRKSQEASFGFLLTDIFLMVRNFLFLGPAKENDVRRKSCSLLSTFRWALQSFDNPSSHTKLCTVNLKCGLARVGSVATKMETSVGKERPALGLSSIERSEDFPEYFLKATLGMLILVYKRCVFK